MNRQHQPLTPYDVAFYADQALGSERSAKVVLPLLFELIQPVSLVDVGCGVGTWLRVAKTLGVSTVLGIDGEHARAAGLRIDEEEFQPADLRVPLPLITRRFDMALCLEVAEHLPSERGPGLVQDLCALADVVVFSAAIPGQGGTDHVNLRSQSAWADGFADNHYAAFDLVRPKVWREAGVEAWYRQNTLVFVRNSRGDLVAAAEDCQASAPQLLDIVHPELLAFWVRRATRPISVAQGVRIVNTALVAAARRRLRLSGGSHR